MSRVGDDIYGTKRWQVTRRKQLSLEPLCSCGEMATDVDHIVPLAEGGEVWSFDNLQSLCHRCHSRKSWRETHDFDRISLLHLVVLVGPIGVGKTEVREALWRRLGYASAGPDDFKDGWRGVGRKLRRADRAVVECCRIPPSLLDELDRATIVKLTLIEDERRRRLLGRGYSEVEAESLVREADDERLSFHAEVSPHLTIEVVETPQRVAERIVEYVRS